MTLQLRAFRDILPRLEDITETHYLKALRADVFVRDIGKGDDSHYEFQVTTGPISGRDYFLRKILGFTFKVTRSRDPHSDEEAAYWASKLNDETYLHPRFESQVKDDAKTPDGIVTIIGDKITKGEYTALVVTTSGERYTLPGKFFGRSPFNFAAQIERLVRKSHPKIVLYSADHLDVHGTYPRPRI